MYTFYPKNIKSLVASFFVGLGLLAASCGGGGGGGGGGGSAPPPPPAPQATDRTVSGSVLGLSTLVGTSQKAQEQTQRNPLKDAVVEIVAYKKNCTQDCETGRLTLNTTEFGSFAGTLKLWSDGGYVVINVKKQGFVEWSRRIDFDKPADINITAELEKTMFAVARRDDAVFRTSTGERVFKFAVFKDINGRKMVKANRDVEIAKQNGQNPVLEITIPADSIPQDVTSLVASLQTFDPITQGDRFPGQYRDNRGRAIVSAGFDYINITDDTGRNLGEIVRQAIAQGKLTKAQANGTRITRWISGNACENILYDFCRNDKSAETGLAEDNQLCGRLTDDEARYVNVPIYTYNPYSGNWEMLGIGTITGYSSVDEAKSTCRQQGSVSVSILITNEDFSNRWWNLDYPLLTQQPKEICIDLTFKSNNGQPLQSVYVYLSDDDNTMSFSGAWGNTGSDGKVRLKTALFNNNDEDRTATLYYYDPVTYEYKEEENVSLGDSPNCAQREITVQTNLCTVTGRVLYEGNPPTPASGQYVYAYSLDSYYWSYATTDREGDFTLNAKCDEVHELYVNYISSRNFKVDNGELSLGDIIIINQPPYAYGWLSSTSVKVGGSVDVYIYGWDAECDKPLKWELRTGDSTLANGEQDSCWLYEVKNIQFTTSSTYLISLVVTDGVGKSTTVDLGQVVVSPTNRAPVISYAYASPSVIQEGRTVYLYAYGYDLDGDTITYKWKLGNQVICESSYCPYQFNQSGIYTLTLELSDGTDTVQRNVEVRVGNVSNIDIIIQSLRTKLFRR